MANSSNPITRAQAAMIGDAIRSGGSTTAGRDPGAEVAAGMIRRATKSAGAAVEVAGIEQQELRAEMVARREAGDRQALGLPRTDGASTAGITASAAAPAREAIGAVARAAEWESANLDRYGRVTAEEASLDTTAIAAWMSVLPDLSPDELRLAMEDRAADTANPDPIAILFINEGFGTKIGGNPDEAAAARAAMLATLQHIADLHEESAGRWVELFDAVDSLDSARDLAAQIRAEAAAGEPTAYLLEAMGVSDDLEAATSDAEARLVAEQTVVLIDNTQARSAR
jgi:hypothetical protein